MMEQTKQSKPKIPIPAVTSSDPELFALGKAPIERKQWKRPTIPNAISWSAKIDFDTPEKKEEEKENLHTSFQEMKSIVL